MMFKGDRDNYIETLPRRSLTTWVTETTLIIQVELISIQAIKVITVARVISDIVWVVLSYNRPDGLWTFFETTG